MNPTELARTRKQDLDDRVVASLSDRPKRATAIQQGLGDVTLSQVVGRLTSMKDKRVRYWDDGGDHGWVRFD